MSKFSTLTYLVNKFDNDLRTSFAEVTVNNNKLFTSKDNDRFEPADNSVNNILNFALSYEVFETKETGYVEMMLN